MHVVGTLKTVTVQENVTINRRVTIKQIVEDTRLPYLVIYNIIITELDMKMKTKNVNRYIFI